MAKHIMAKHICTADCWSQIIRYGIDPYSNTGDCDPFEAQRLADEENDLY